MPELKNTFTGGRMEKDLDERIVPRGLYREALNIDVSNSEDSDVGAVQNILGNLKVTEAIQGDKGDYVLEQGVPSCTYTPSQNVNGRYYGTNYHIASTINPQTDMIYRFISTTPDTNNNHGVWMDRIVEYNTTKTLSTLWWQKEKSIFVDIYKVQTEIYEIDVPTMGCDQSIIHVCSNSFQLKWGMVIRDDNGNIPPTKDVFIEKVVYNGDIAILTLSENIDSHISQWDSISFHGDRVLNFHPNRKITGINIIDDMLFWTDNYSEPKKVNIARDRVGSNSSLYGSGWDHNGGISRTYGCDPGGDQVCFSDFDQHTKLIVKTSVARECNKKTDACPVTGCTNPLASNYDPFATIDDGSCTMPTYGCTDPYACNSGSYNFLCDAQAVLDGHCLTADECEYTSCAGCTDPLANNYDSLAAVDDGSCTYYHTCKPIGFDQIICGYFDENQQSVEPRMGINGNYGVSPNIFLPIGGAEGLLQSLTQYGTAPGHQPAKWLFWDQVSTTPANEDCHNPNHFATSPTSGVLTKITAIVLEELDDSGNVVGSPLETFSYTGNTSYTHPYIHNIVTTLRDTYYWNGVVDAQWNQNGSEILSGSGGETWNNINIKMGPPNGLQGSGYTTSRRFMRLRVETEPCECNNIQTWPDPNFQVQPANWRDYPTCERDDASLDDLTTCNTNCIDQCTACLSDSAQCLNGVSAVYGCTDITATNYNSLADCDDGSCIPILYGCTDSCAVNYNSVANTDDGSCLYGGCTDPYAINHDCATCFNPNSLAPCSDGVAIDDGSCITSCTGEITVPDNILEASLEGGTMGTGSAVGGWYNLASSNNTAGMECDSNGTNCDGLVYSISDTYQDGNSQYYSCCDWPGQISLDGEGITDTTGLEAFGSIWSFINKNNAMTTHHQFRHPWLTSLHLANQSVDGVNASTFYDLVDAEPKLPSLKRVHIGGSSSSNNTGMDQSFFDYGEYNSTQGVWTTNSNSSSQAFGLRGFMTGCINLQDVSVVHNDIKYLDLRHAPNVINLLIWDNPNLKHIYLGQPSAETMLALSGLVQGVIDADSIFDPITALNYPNGFPMDSSIKMVGINQAGNGADASSSTHPENVKIILGIYFVTCDNTIYAPCGVDGSTGWNNGSTQGNAKKFAEWLGEQGGWFINNATKGGMVTTTNFNYYFASNATDPSLAGDWGMTSGTAVEFCQTWDDVNQVCG